MWWERIVLPHVTLGCCMLLKLLHPGEMGKLRGGLHGLAQDTSLRGGDWQGKWNLQSLQSDHHHPDGHHSNLGHAWSACVSGVDLSGPLHAV